MCGVEQTLDERRTNVFGMLHEFLTSNRQAIISLCRDKVARRFEPGEPAATMQHGVPQFLEQLVETLRAEQKTHIRESADVDPAPAQTPIGRVAALHGTELLRLGFSVDQVVHDYGDVCQSVTALAVEQNEPISTDEFRTLNRCLDNAIADAVASFGSGRQKSIDHEAVTLQQRLIAFAAEHRQLTDIALKALTAIQTGNIGINGATGTLLAHTLEELSSLTDRSLPEIRLASTDAKGASV
ncbi:MAG: hypothetical protein ABSG12_14055 [Steroidobacteraceae bacterium]